MRTIVAAIAVITVLSCSPAKQEPAPPTHVNKVAAAALLLTNDEVEYDPSYFTIPYPNGDVPSNKGVCTDVVIRAYRKLVLICKKKCTKIWLLILTCTQHDMDYQSRIGI